MGRFTRKSKDEIGRAPDELFFRGDKKIATVRLRIIDFDSNQFEVLDRPAASPRCRPLRSGATRPRLSSTPFSHPARGVSAVGAGSEKVTYVC